MKNDSKAPKHIGHITTRHPRKLDGRDSIMKFDVEGNEHIAKFRLERIELRHFQVDVLVCGDETGCCLGRPWITTAVDGFSSMVVGYSIGFEPPGGLAAAGTCISHSILPKDEWLRENEGAFQQEPEWPCHELPLVLHLDNSKEFRGGSLARACERYGIATKSHLVNSQQRINHIERLVNRMAKRLGKSYKTTFPDSDRHNEIDNSERGPAMRWREFKRWLAALICGKYHYRPHSDLNGKSPLERWYQGCVEGTKLASPLNVRSDRHLREAAERLRIDFLPGIERVISTQGVRIDSIWYMSYALLPWIDAPAPKNPRRQRVFMFRRDPHDISVVHFWNPMLGKYEPIRRRDLASPPMTLWEWKAVLKRLRAQPKPLIDEQIKNKISDQPKRIGG